MKVLICPDKFKGSLTAQEVCDHVDIGLKECDSSIETIKLPLADGGEGTLDVLGPILNLEPVILEVNDPLFRPVMATYYRSENSAYIEMAMASGLQLLTVEERNAMHTSTYGTGELIVDAVKNGATEIYLFVGGSATNDAGIGMASAMGYQLYDEFGDTLGTTGECLNSLRDFHLVDPQMAYDTVKFYVITDVKNTFYGPEGAAHVYGKQKGANDEEIEILDRGLQNFCDVVESKMQLNLQAIAGSGAAGGLGGGAIVFLNAEISSGIETILDMVGFRKHLMEVDYVITGEGKFDEQTLHGKVIAGVAAECKEMNKPFGVICGISTVSEGDVQSMGVDKVVALVGPDANSDKAMKEAGILVEKRMSQFV
ncbi:MAG: glycerate kinase [bacterium]|nr:glycerate kinase [bacterium]